jgi:hypothetical protein
MDIYEHWMGGPKARVVILLSAQRGRPGCRPIGARTPRLHLDGAISVM